MVARGGIEFIEALDTLEQAVSAGWRDGMGLEQDPEMRPLLREAR
jgi:hypothetical protein